MYNAGIGVKVEWTDRHETSNTLKVSSVSVSRNEILF